MTTFTIDPEGPFSLDAAAAFGFGPHSGRPKPEGNAMKLAFVTDDFTGHAGVSLRQNASGCIEGRIVGSQCNAPNVIRQVKRILSLDHSGVAWLDVGRRDPVLARLQRAHPGLRPVLFHSPYEAAAWSIISLRRQRRQATAVRRELSRRFGAVLDVDGESIEAFPTPLQLLAAKQSDGLDDTRMRRLHAVAEAALAGQLDAKKLLSLPIAGALAQLEQLPGIGPFYAMLIMLRSTGAKDLLTQNEPRASKYIAHYYGLPRDAASPAQVAHIAEQWRPFRTWATVLIRVSGDREQLQFSKTG